MALYRFTCEEENRTVTHEFETESDMWSRYDGPLANFFTFLKGVGFVFEVNSAIGVMKENGQFIDAEEEVNSL